LDASSSFDWHQALCALTAVSTMALALLGQDKDRVGVAAAGDWRCMGCNELMLAKYPNCRKCGEAKPQSADLQLALAGQMEAQLALQPLNTGMSPVIMEMNKGEDWQCPLCKEFSFANRSTCRRCGCPRPEGAMVIQTVQHQLAQGGYIGYLPDVGKIEATSSWAKQFDTGPLPGAMSLNMMQMTATPFDPSANYASSSSSSSLSSSSSSDSESGSKPKKKKAKIEEKKDKDADKPKKKAKIEEKKETDAEKGKSSSDSSSSSSGSEGAKRKKKLEASEKKKAVEAPKLSEKEAKAAAKAAKAAAKAKEKAKQEKKFKKTMGVEEELEKRRLQRERRKNRTVVLA